MFVQADVFSLKSAVDGVIPIQNIYEKRQQIEILLKNISFIRYEDLQVLR